MASAESTEIRFDVVCEVVAMRNLSESIVEISARPRDGEPITFLAGQYLLLEDPGHRLDPRSYSIANTPRPDGLLSFLVTRVPGGQLSNWIHDELRPGERISVSGPYGEFTAESEGEGPVLYLAAGSGLAPVRALVEAGLESDPDRDRTVIFSARTEDDVLDRSRFDQWSRDYPEFRIVRTLTRGEGPGPHGRVPSLIGDLCGDLAAHDIYIAGGPGFVTSCAAAAEASGAERSRIRTEPFFVDGQSGYPT